MAAWRGKPAREVQDSELQNKARFLHNYQEHKLVCNNLTIKWTDLLIFYIRAFTNTNRQATINIAVPSPHGSTTTNYSNLNCLPVL